MGVLLRLIIGKPGQESEKKNIVWNMIGSFLYALSSMVLSIAVVSRIVAMSLCEPRS